VGGRRERHVPADEGRLDGHLDARPPERRRVLHGLRRLHGRG
jgi:hypothetical protein